MSEVTTFADAKLYELADLRARITVALEASEGELTDDVAAALDAWQVDFPAKVQSCVLYAKDIEGDAVKIDNEIARLKQKKAALENRYTWIEGYIARCLDVAGVQDAGGPLGSAKFQKSPPKVEVLTPMDDAELRNIATWAPQFVRHTETWALDKDAVKAAAKAGTLDADMQKRVKVTQGRSLRLK